MLVSRPSTAQKLACKPGSAPAPVTREERIAREAATLPGRFGLRAFPGDTFRVSLACSYLADHDGTVILYTERLTDDGWLSFAKGTLRELQGQIVPTT